MSLDTDEKMYFSLNINRNYTKNVFGVAYDGEKERVYWAESGCKNEDQRGAGGTLLQKCNGTGSINSIFLNGTGISYYNINIFVLFCAIIIIR